MKARVKGTTAIIDVTFDKDALNAGYPPYKAGGGIYYYPEQLVWIDNIDSTEPDYWEKLKHQYAGMAIQGLLSNSVYLADFAKYSVEGDHLARVVSRNAIDYATALVSKLKEESQCEK